MYVCLCNKVTDTQIIRAHKQGATSINCLKERLKVSDTCGSCIEHAQEILDTCEELQQTLNESQDKYSLATNVA
ncbi:MAG: (2Fe-2S)-binding protein [Enterobacterales bacterium]|nr:(2Fe-2S)-binding protein [Enterobacterales bacterium]